MNQFNADRRQFLLGLAGLTSLALVSGLSPVKTWANPKFPISPFQLGVASGDPWPDGFVIWTRVAPYPLSVDGGMPNEAVNVKWEVALDRNFKKIVQTGEVQAHPDLHHTVHVEVTGLAPQTRYYYRFFMSDYESPIGTAKSAPSAQQMPNKVRIAVVGCQHYETGYYTAYDYLSKEEDIDIVFHYGDYIYEGPEGKGGGRAIGNLRVSIPARQHIGPEIQTLFQYRIRYAQYRADPNLQAAHASAPFAITFDDHEVDNNWVADLEEKGEKREIFLLRRAAAFQAWYEYMPVRLAQKPQGPDITAYRTLDFGQMLRMNILDTRQYRSPILCSKAQLEQGLDTNGYCRTDNQKAEHMLGKVQEEWLARQMRHDKRWNILAQQIQVMPWVRYNKSGNAYFGKDTWNGYPYARERLIQSIHDNAPNGNTVILSGDLHQYFVANIPSDLNDYKSQSIATEFLTTSITSTGNGQPIRPGQEDILKLNPHIKFINDQRGYQTLDFFKDHMRTDLNVLDFVEKPGGKLSIAASFEVEYGKPEVKRV